MEERVEHEEAAVSAADSEPREEDLRSPSIEKGGIGTSEIRCEDQINSAKDEDFVSKSELMEDRDKPPVVMEGIRQDLEGGASVGGDSGEVVLERLRREGEGGVGQETNGEGERSVNSGGGEGGVNNGGGEGGVGQGTESRVGGDDGKVSSEEKNVGKQSATSQSIYLDNGTTSRARPPPSKPRRLTRAERARQEALASFGGMDFSSVTVRKRDLRDELRRDAQVTKEGQDGGNRVKHKTRLQAAKEESSALFNDVVFGERRTRKRRQEEDTDSESKPKVARRMTKAEKAKQDALQSFGGCGFDAVMATSVKKIARNMELNPKGGEGGGEGEGEEGGEGERVEGGEEEKENMEVPDIET